MIGDLTGNLTGRLASNLVNVGDISATEKISRLPGLVGMHDPYDEAKLFADDTPTTQATVGGKVGLMQSVSTGLNDFAQISGAVYRPTLVEESGGAMPLRALRFTGSEDLSMTLPSGPDLSDVSLLFAFKTTDQVFIYVSPSGDSTRYAYYGDTSAGAVSVNAGTPTVYVDGVAYASRDTLSAAASDGNWHIGELRGADLSTWPTINICGYGGVYRWGADIARSVYCENSTLTQNRTLIENWVSERLP